MGIYQIIAIHSRPWSQREIVFFGSVIMAVALLLLAAAGMRRIKKSQAVSVLAALVYIVLVFGSTVFTRGLTDRQCELTLFWSWREMLAYHDREMLQQILLNCVMLAPVGLLLPAAAGRRVRPAAALAVGVLLSGMIEVSQFVFRRGLFELDDIIHNSLGCMIGCMAANAALHFFLQRKSRRAGAVKAVAA